MFSPNDISVQCFHCQHPAFFHLVLEQYRYFGSIKNYKIALYQIKPSSLDLPTDSYLDQPVKFLKRNV